MLAFACRKIGDMPDPGRRPALNAVNRLTTAVKRDS